MKHFKLMIVALLASPLARAEPAHYWTFDTASNPAVTLRGESRLVEGVVNQSLALDGRSLIEVNDSIRLTHGEAGFSLTVWVNPYALGPDQQMIAAKNRYSLNQREWGVMIDKDGRFRLYVRQDDWQTIACEKKPKPGHWHLVGVTSDATTAGLWVNGERVGEISLGQSPARTAAPLTFGGVNDNGRIWQNLFGALDEARLFDRVLSEKEMASLYRPVKTAHPIPNELATGRIKLWNPAQPFLNSAELEVLKDVTFHVIKKWEPEIDRYRWLHGVALAWHRGKLYASFGHNVGKENTLTEEGRFCVSEDGGKTWSAVKTIDAGMDTDDLAVSHGVILSQGETLWSFLGAFHGTRKRVHTRAYTLDEARGIWQPKGIVIDNGFWPMQEPVRMKNGNWILAGFIVGHGNPAAVAISEGNDLTKWKPVIIPKGRGVGPMWGESTIIVDGRQVLNLARYGAKPLALAAQSDDFGLTWTPSAESNLPMTTSKPAAGLLSTGQRYLVCTTTADSGGRRAPLTIAIGQPGEKYFSKVFVIRHATFPEGHGESHPNARLSYPYAIEYEDKLYIGYSNSGNRGGNQNSAELAIIPLRSLR